MNTLGNTAINGFTMLGRHHSEETKEKIRASNLGRQFSVEARAKMRVAALNRLPRSEETKLKMRIVHLGKNKYPKTEQHKKKLSLAMLGRPMSEGTRQALYIANIGHHRGGWHLKEEAILKMSGANSPSWKGGLSNEPYPPEFNRRYKELIGNRDNHTCQLCGVPQEECLRVLDTHHIDYDKRNIDERNLISLCRSCNGKVNSNRGYWQEYFTSIIAKIYAQEGGDEVKCYH